MGAVYGTFSLVSLLSKRRKDKLISAVTRAFRIEENGLWCTRRISEARGFRMRARDTRRVRCRDFTGAGARNFLKYSIQKIRYFRRHLAYSTYFFAVILIPGFFLAETYNFQVNDDAATLRLNPYSWNNNASILTLESPAGVGFSYATDGNLATGDDQTASENWEALVAFFQEFPQYVTNDFYVTGESYGGIYVCVYIFMLIYNLIRCPPWCRPSWTVRANLKLTSREPLLEMDASRIMKEPTR